MQLRRARPNTTAVLALAALATAALAGCTDATAGATPGDASTASAGATPTGATTSTTGGVRTLSDTGIGGLSLGQTKKQAMATGLVGGLETSSELCEARRGRDGVQHVYFVDGKVSIIAVGPSIRLAGDLGVGDTYADLHAIYPDAEESVGKLFVEASAAAVKARYRIGIDSERAYPDSKITEIALQADDQSCYE